MVTTPTRRSFPALYVAFALMFLLLVGQLFNMQVLQGSSYQTDAVKNRERTVRTDAIRGIIYDRSGQKLVVNNPSYSIAVTPADLPDIQCGIGKMTGSKVFEQLAATLATSDVIALTPSKLPAEKMVEVANLLSVPLQVNKNILLSSMQDIMGKWSTSTRMFLLRQDVPVAAGETLKAELDQMPGISIYNSLEYNFITRFDACYEPIVVARGVDYTTGIQAEVTKLRGVSVISEPVRAYQNSSYFSHLLGYVGPISQDAYDQNKAAYRPDDKVGQVGLEASLEDQLRGQKGEAQYTVNSDLQIVNQISSTAPITGNNVSLTVDASLQISVTQALQKGLDTAKVKAGVAIVLSVTDGQVLSMVSLPSYDNNLFSAGISQADYDTLNGDPTLPMFNRAISGAYPPGSTYKMITASAALQEGVVQPDTTFFCPGYIAVPYTLNEKQRNNYRDWRAAGQGTINVVQALTVSSDVFFYIAAGPHQQDSILHNDDGTDTITWTRYYVPGAAKPTEFNGLGIDRLHKYAQAFGLGVKTGIDLPSEVSGLAPDPAWKVSSDPQSPWSLGDTLVTAIGQGYDLVTPLQLVNITSAVANGGTLYKPQLVLNVTDSSGKVVQGYKPEVIRQVPVSPGNLALVRQGMYDVVSDKKGTAYSKINVPGVQVAGKTGTAEFGEPIGIKDGKEVRRAHAWFTAFAPYDNPQIAVVVLLEGGQESLEGSTYAVPVANEILNDYFQLKK